MNISPALRKNENAPGVLCWGRFKVFRMSMPSGFAPVVFVRPSSQALVL